MPALGPVLAAGPAPTTEALYRSMRMQAAWFALLCKHGLLLASTGVHDTPDMSRRALAFPNAEEKMLTAIRLCSVESTVRWHDPTKSHIPRL